MPQQYFVYMMANTSHTVLYTGVTNNLVRSVGEDKSKSIEGFTKRYNVVKLVYFEIFEDHNGDTKRENN